MKNLLLRFWKEDSGQSTAEYILILAVVVMIAMRFKAKFQDKLMTIVDQLGVNLDSAVSNSQ
jgi:Flp pilus assembly pilin Flp